MRHFIRTVILLANLLCFVYASNAFSQEVNIEYPYKHYTVQDGLVQMQVQAIYQDSKGYLWLGTKTGISRFDGKNFKNYNALDINQKGPVAFFDEDSNQNLWVFNHNNISVLSDDSIFTLEYPGDYSIQEEHAPFKSQSLCLSGISIRKEILTQILNYTDPDSLYIEDINPKYGSVICFDELSNKQVWHGYRDSLILLDISTLQTIKTYKNPGITFIKYLNHDLYGFSKRHGVFKLTKDGFISIINMEFKGGQIKVITSPDSTSLIIKSLKGLYVFDGELKCIKENMTSIRDIMFDHENNLWVATEEGLFNFFQLNFVNYTFGMGNKDWVWTILEDDKKNMWFSSFQNGIWKWDGQKVTNYTELVNLKIRSHLVSGPLSTSKYSYFMGGSKYGSTLYFPTQFNVLEYDGTNFKPVDKIASIMNKAYCTTKTGSSGTLYCGGMSGLFEISANGKTRHWSKDSLGVSDILSVEIDTNNNITAIGEGGIADIKNDTIIRYNHHPSQKYYTSTKDHYNNIWVGGTQKLDLLNKDTLISVVQNISEIYSSLLFVEPHYLLLGGLNGLYVANLKDYYSNKVFEPILYNQNNGFSGIECGKNGFFTDSEGYVWINTSDLVSRFDPKKLINNKPAPPNLYVNSKMSSDNIEWQDLEKITKHHMSYDQNNFKFQFDAVSFTNPGNIRYYYWLDGLQPEWSEASTTNEVSFHHLQPGKYRLLVKADAGISEAMSEVVTIKFTIEKPYWLQWWFILFEALLLVLLIVLVVKILNNRVRKKELIKKNIVQLRADALKSQMNPHLIYNALNNINGLINLGHKKEAQNYLITFSNLLRLVLQSTDKNEITLENEFEIIKSFVKFHQQAKAYRFDFEIKSTLNVDLNKILIPPVLIQPYVENAILHGFSNKESDDGSILIQVKNTDKRLIIIIEDNGVGIGNSEYKGSGLGTKLTQERIKLLEKRSENQVEIIKLEQGTRVVINIPLKLLK